MCAGFPTIPNHTVTGGDNSIAAMPFKTTLAVSLNVTLTLPAGFGLPDGPPSDAELAKALDGLSQVQVLAGGGGGSVQLSLSEWAIGFRLYVTTLQSAGAQATGSGSLSGVNPCAASELKGLALNLSSRLLFGPEGILKSAPNAACVLAALSDTNSSSLPLSTSVRGRNLLVVSLLLQKSSPAGDILP